MRTTYPTSQSGRGTQTAGLPIRRKLLNAHYDGHALHPDEPLLHNDAYTFVVVDRLEDGTVDTVRYLHTIKGKGVFKEGAISYYPGCLVDYTV